MLPATCHPTTDKDACSAPKTPTHFQPAVLRAAESPKKRHRRHANPFTVREHIEAIDFDALFGRSAPLALDVGAGPGQFSVALAQRFEQFNVVGVEIRPHLVVELEAAAQQAQVRFCRGLLANANLQLPALLPPDSVAFVSLNFPDPWFKKRHHKRRVLTSAWLQALRPKLRKDAEIHIMTDYLPLALVMRETCLSTAYLEPISEVDDWPEQSTTGLLSEREVTHTRRLEPIYRMAFRCRKDGVGAADGPGGQSSSVRTKND